MAASEQGPGGPGRQRDQIDGERDQRGRLRSAFLRRVAQLLVAQLLDACLLAATLAVTRAFYWTWTALDVQRGRWLKDWAVPLALRRRAGREQLAQEPPEFTLVQIRHDAPYAPWRTRYAGGAENALPRGA